MEKVTQKIVTKTEHIVLPKNAVAHKTTSKIPIVNSNQTIAQVLQLIFQKHSSFKTINYIYVVTKTNKLIGVLSIKDLFKHPQNSKIKKIMALKPFKAHATTKYDRVVSMALKHNLKAIPIINKKERFLGVIPSDQILSILNNENKKRLYHIAGVVGKSSNFASILNIPIFTSFLQRIPWILVGLAGGLITAKVINNFDSILKTNLILASFIPLVAYVANAVGIQTQTLFVRDLSVNNRLPFTKYSYKQLISSLLIATVCGISLFLFGLFSFNSIQISLIISLAVFAAITNATIFALLIPFILSKLKIDPAIGSGPFSTIIQDLLSIIIYFSIASSLI